MIHRFNLIEKILLARDVIPHPLMDAGALIGVGRALTAALRLGLVDALDSQPKSAKQLAQSTELSERGVVAVLDCLDALGYVAREDNGYRLTKRGQRFLTKSSPHGFRSMLRFSHWTYNSFLDLEDTIRAGKPSRNNLEHFTSEQWEDFARAMIELSRTNLDEVTRLIPVPKDAKRVLDLGGCHGLYSAALCEGNPQLTAEVMDFSAVRQYFDESMAERGMTDRVTFREGDFTKDPLGEGYDLILAFNIVHGFDEDANLALAQRVRRALSPGGAYVVLDQVREAAGGSALSRLTTSFMALNLLHQAGGFTYSLADMDRWAQQVGFTSTKLRKLRAPGFGVVTLR